ncbi:aminopeptidase [Mycobacterium ahvazicum]|uniref:Aminopeptidase n=1 Tax=Mycobacterium ahvazicum TaxID=1964395 RepID=A0A2K4YD66_9MYCO|nr:aminopeptidase [Mycobacterium ahvazicum]SOX54729.1 aminopeptidase [Mycobacterium ahvazicum]
MTVRRLILAVAAVLLLAGVIGLLVPVSVSDGNGGSLGCGNAVVADLTAARNANDKSVANIPIVNQVVPHTDYVARCESELGTRRTWTIPLTIVGLVAIAGALLVRREGAPAA